MRVLFLCKASIDTGLGHLIRSRSLAATFHKELVRRGVVKLAAIGPEKILNPLLQDETCETEIFSDENNLQWGKEKWDFVFFDMLEAGDRILQEIKKHARYTATLSPVFNRMKEMDFFFHRTKFHNLPKEQLPAHSFMGLEYAIIQQNCKRIGAGRFEENLQNHSFPIAVSMGGGDAANKTLSFLKTVKKCRVPATIWVMLGEGYQHSYDQLIQETKENNRHEIILAKTNRSMWQIMQNCILGIFPGGITTYEAAFAGLPAINIYEHEGQIFLIQELLEGGASYLGGKREEKSFKKINSMIEELYNSRFKLMEMHLKAKALIDGRGKERIFDVCNSWYNR